MQNRAFITGITGQDGSFLTELLLSKGYEVHGLVRRASSGYGNLRNILHLVNNPKIYRKTLHLHAGDMADGTSLERILAEIKPDEVYNLAAQADVQESFLMPEYSLDINGTSVIRLLEAVRRHCPLAKFYQASTSELFGNTNGVEPQNEDTPFNPQSPYSIGKLAGFFAVKKYREMYNIFACNGILFNHESERRGDDYVTRKVTRAVARIKNGVQDELRLGNLEAKRDWGYSPEYVEAAWKILHHLEPRDFVIGTGETHTVKEWVKACFEHAGLDMEKYVVSDPKLFRPAEVDILRADSSRAKNLLTWEPQVKFAELVKIMMEHDLNDTRSEALP